MKCPHCGYVDGFSDNDKKNISGKEGMFYHASDNINMTRLRAYGCVKIEVQTLVGCPKCKKVFIGE